MSEQRYEVRSLPGFVQQVGVSCVARGYFFYVTGRVPDHKDPAALDRKFEERYQLDVSKWTRSRRKLTGAANLRYVRYGRFFVLLATPGEHEFFKNEAKGIRDVRRVPLKVGGYAISHRGGHLHVRIERETYKRLKAHLVDLAARRSVETMEREFRGIPFEPYRPVVRQVLCILRAVNRVRKAAGFERVPVSCLRMFREIQSPFTDGKKPRTRVANV